MWKLPGLNKIVVDSNPTVYLNQQMQDIGYSNRNAVFGLGTFTFLIYLYFIRCALVLIIKIIRKLSKKKCIKKKQIK